MADWSQVHAGANTKKLPLDLSLRQHLAFLCSSSFRAFRREPEFHLPRQFQELAAFPPLKSR